jgi:hypothetical protein
MKPRNDALERHDFDVESEVFGIDLVPWKEASRVGELLSESFQHDFDYKLNAVAFYPIGLVSHVMSKHLKVLKISWNSRTGVGPNTIC